MRGGKTKDEARVVSLNQEVRQMLGLVPRNGEYVFGGTRTVGSFRKAWASACKRAGVPETLFRDLRRSGVRNLRRAGVAREVSMRMSGHKTESVCRRYSIVSERDLREAVDKPDNLLDSDKDTGNEDSLVRLTDKRRRNFGASLVQMRTNVDSAIAKSFNFNGGV